MSSWKLFKNLHWYTHQPISSIRKYDSENDKLVSAKDILDKKVPIKPGDRIVILRHCPANCNKKTKELPVLTEPIRGNTIRAVMNALERGLRRPLKSGNRGRSNTKKGDYYFEPSQKYDFPPKNKVVYDKISNYVDSHTRLELIKKYESGNLKPYELYGDYAFFEGIYRRGKYLYFSVAS